MEEQGRGVQGVIRATTPANGGRPKRIRINRPSYSFRGKIPELYGSAWWKVKPMGSKSKVKKKKGRATPFSRGVVPTLLIFWQMKQQPATKVLVILRCRQIILPP